MISSACCAACLARLQVFLDDLLEVVHSVEVDVIELRDLGCDVARHGDVDHEDRAMSAALQRGADHLLVENVQWRCRLTR